jgi:uncharacterized membrane protein (DUF373 family)
MSKFAKTLEKGIIYVLILMMALVLVFATIELGYYLFRSIMQSNYLLLDLNDLMDLFGVFLLVLIGIELLDTIKVYLRRSVVQVEVVVLVAIIALARKIIILDIEELEIYKLLGLAALMIALAIAYYLIKRVYLMEYGKEEMKTPNNTPDTV